MFIDYARVLDDTFSQFRGSKFSVRLWDGQVHTYGKGKNTFTLVFQDKETVKRLLAQGSLGFGEAYMEGRLRIEGSLDAYMRQRYQFKHVRRSYRLAIATALSMLSVPRNPKQQISHHYDLGNDFFQLFLDHPTMSYSAGLYDSDSDGLANAQQKKLALICTWLNLPAGSSVLDLGSGWGGFAVYAAKQHDWNVTGYTLSRAQLGYCRALARQEKLEHRIHFQYRDMLTQLPTKPHDAIVMLESIEHVSKDKLGDFFGQLRQAVRVGGSIYIQNTGRYKQRPSDKWTLKYIFPGGYLPSLGELVSAAGEAGFALETFRDDTNDYTHTITEWIENAERHRTEIETQFGESFYRMWELWLYGARAGFATNSISLFRLHFRRLR